MEVGGLKNWFGLIGILTTLSLGCIFLLLQIPASRDISISRYLAAIRLPESINALNDLTFEFENEKAIENNTLKEVNVLEELKKDGHRPVPVSKYIDRCWEKTGDQRDRCIKAREESNCSSIASAQNQTRKESTDDLIVPNVVHYVFISSNWSFTFIHYLSFLSVERFLKPDQIFVHGDIRPKGKWWNRTLSEVNNIYHVHKPFNDISPNRLKFKYMVHITDFIRARTLLLYGGIYLDPDVLVLKSFDPLRKYPAVFGRENSFGICNGIILARRGAFFLRLLLEQYRSYRGEAESWGRTPVLNVHTLAEIYPHLIHVEETSLNRPSWEKGQIELIFAGRYNWSSNYAMHLWVRLWPNETIPTKVEDVRKLNTTMGEISRYILFCSNKIKSYIDGVKL